MFLAEYFNARKIVLIGMDFGRKIGKYSKHRIVDRRIKIKKLKFGKKVVESGGGCYPAMYSCKGLSKAVNVEPLFYKFPEEVKQRVEVEAGIECLSIPFEDFETEEKFDEEPEGFVE